MAATFSTVRKLAEWIKSHPNWVSDEEHAAISLAREALSKRTLKRAKVYIHENYPNLRV